MSVGISSGQVETEGIKVTQSENGLVNFVSNAELDRVEEARITAAKPPEPVINIGNLPQHVRIFFAAAKTAKQETENKLLEILRQIKGEYEADKLQAIRSFGGSTDFIKLTQQKVRDAESWIIDIIDPYGDQTWEIEPTPIADLPSDVVAFMKGKLRQRMMSEAVAQAGETGEEFNTEQLLQEMGVVEKKVTKLVKKRVQELSREKSTNMRTKIKDQLEEGGWNIAFRQCINDLSRLKSCIMKGPVYKRVPRTKWKKMENGQWDPQLATEVIPMFSRVNPFDWYPAAKSSHVNIGDAIELEHLSPIDLERMLNVSGYINANIKRILTDMPQGFIEQTSVRSERQDLEKDNTNQDLVTEPIYDMLNYWGVISGRILIDHGTKAFKDESIVPGKYYSVNIKTINDIMVKEPVLNPDPLGHKPYDVTSFIKNNDSQWGESPAEQMTDIQSICNATVRALLNNIAISSGPLTEMDQGRLAAGETGEIWPHKRIMTTNKNMSEGPAVRFYQSKLLAAELLGVYDKFKKEADDLVVPSFGRTDIGGAGRTSSGLALLMGAAARNIKLAILNVDQDIVMPKLQKLFNGNMLFLNDDSIKGDIRVKARGTGGVISKEQLAIRRNEFRATLSPEEKQLIGAPGMAYILKKTLESLDMDVEKAMPGYEELESLDALTPPPLPQEGATGAVNPARPRVLDVAGGKVGGNNETSFARESGRPVENETS